MYFRLNKGANFTCSTEFGSGRVYQWIELLWALCPWLPCLLSLGHWVSGAHLPGLGLVSRCAPASPHSWPQSLSLLTPGTAQSNPIPGPGPCTQSATNINTSYHWSQWTIQDNPQPPGVISDTPWSWWGWWWPGTSVSQAQASNRCLLTPHSLQSWGPRTLVSGERHATNQGWAGI